MLLNSLPVRFLITRAARAYGFLDPFSLLAKMRGFSQPSEVAEPIELLRAGMIFHARGLVNSKAIQNNLDWVWPYWVERQFNPADDSFIPRAFSFSHINLTHRNWTAVGLPDVPFYPIVDPRGLVTPLFDGWSLDFWFVPPTGAVQPPSKLTRFTQILSMGENLSVRSTAVYSPNTVLETVVSMALENGEPHCHVSAWLTGGAGGSVAVALRPYNPEGISFVERVAIADNRRSWLINHRHPVFFDRPPAHHALCDYREGDVFHRLRDPSPSREVVCPASMATAAALFPAEAVHAQPLQVRVPIYDELEPRKRPVFAVTEPWSVALASLTHLKLGDARIQNLYDLAVANLVLHAPDEVYPGPFTYKRFWFRDAAFILHVLLSLGGVERTRRALRAFAPRQRHDGYFLSQEGEWDSNGEAIWMYHRFATLTGEAPKTEWIEAVKKGARWIMRKRLPANSGRPEAGLLPAGFSAEHLGPNDFYYWDDFWGVAGLRSAAELLRNRDPALAAQCDHEAAEFLATIERSFPHGPQRRFPGAIPASPKRRMDSGAVGSLVADYPLRLFPAGDERILKTVDYLRDHSSHNGGFFQNMIHSGINPYLTLHLAQVRLRAGQFEEMWRLLDCVASLASPTGQWPEAVHPRTDGGCMGDGQHIWAAAEWAMMIRNCFVGEERDRLVIAAGLRPEWWHDGEAAIGPTLTPFGPVSVHVRPVGPGAQVAVSGRWSGPAPLLEVRLPGFAPQMRASGGAAEIFQLIPSP